MKRKEEDIVNRVRDIAEPVLEAEGLELVEIQFRRERGGWTLRLFIDRAPLADEQNAINPSGSGVTIDDCAESSREIGRLLDMEEAIDFQYTLEVSSPGLNRPLTKPVDYERFAGRKIKVKIAGPEGRRTIKGILLGLEDNVIKIDVNGQTEEAPIDQTERVQLVPVVDWAKA